MIPSDLDPIGVFLVSSGTRGDRLLFRYPFELPVATESLPECKKLLAEVMGKMRACGDTGC